jgi:hypothetical protein
VLGVPGVAVPVRRVLAVALVAAGRGQTGKRSRRRRRQRSVRIRGGREHARRRAEAHQQHRHDARADAEPGSGGTRRVRRGRPASSAWRTRRRASSAAARRAWSRSLSPSPSAVRASRTSPVRALGIRPRQDGWTCARDQLGDLVGKVIRTSGADGRAGRWRARGGGAMACRQSRLSCGGAIGERAGHQARGAPGAERAGRTRRQRRAGPQPYAEAPSAGTVTGQGRPTEVGGTLKAGSGRRVEVRRRVEGGRRGRQRGMVDLHACAWRYGRLSKHDSGGFKRCAVERVTKSHSEAQLAPPVT